MVKKGTSTTLLLLPLSLDKVKAVKALVLQKWFLIDSFEALIHHIRENLTSNKSFLQNYYT